MSRAHETATEWTSFVELLGLRAREEPDKRLFAFLPDGEDGGAITFTRGELDRRARALAARLQAIGLAGQRALLLYPPGLGFIEALCGCLYAGVIAVPAYPPRVNRPMTRLRSIVGDALPSVVLTCATQNKDAQRWESGVPELQGLHRVVTDAEGQDLDRLAKRWRDPGAQHDTLALLQYTSGSTAVPRGVMITHGNLLHNSALIHDCFDSTPEGRGVFWLPLFHDMGLSGGVIHTIYCGGSSTLLSPVQFLHRPNRWLQAISRTRATISGAPNFAYELCVERTTPEQRADLDLSCWRVAFNGAETVRPETLDRFAEAFAPAGFRREAFLPCYGLAEATLLVSGGPSGTPPVVLSVDAEALGRGEVAAMRHVHQGKCLVSSGEVVAGHSVFIVDPSTRRQCTENQIGEIWVSGPSVAGGYWGRTAESQETLRANLSEGGEGPFLRTGDLGFLKDRMLFVTGRIKDMIILRGRNVYPQDVEWTAERCHPALCTGGAATFGVEIDGEEQLAIVQELNRHFDRGVIGEVIASIRRAISDQFDIEVHAIRLIQPLSLPKTSSGKVQRHLCRQDFLNGSLEIVAEWTRRKVAGPSLASKSSDTIERSNMCTPAGPRSADAIVAWLTERISGPIGIRPDEVDTKKPLAGYGLGSLQAVQLASDLEQWLGLKLPPTLAYDYPTIDALAHFLSDSTCSPKDGRMVQPGRREDREPIAIIGIGCRFPGANGPVGFWRLLRDGVEAVGPIPASRWDHEALQGLDLPRGGGFLAVVDQFDADFFGISPREAVFVDPQQRLLLEVAWEAIEDGGQAPERLAGAPVGVFVGISTNDYAQLQAMRGGASDGYRITGSAASIAANRISHHFDFRGPSLTIDTACSSSLVAVHLACKSLWDGECELAVAGGVNLILVPEVFASFAKAGFLSPDGKCKAFDAQADGYVRGEGAGMLALKPLSSALADGDPIYAVIRGGAVNQDGRTNGLTAPNRSAQEAVLRAAYRQAGVSPEQIDYIEAHGTGTLLGDPIEISALAAVLAEGRDLDRRCALGSVKTNIGHLEAAAGVAGLIKTALALHHRKIPPSLHFSQPNPHIAFDEIPLQVQRKTDAWPDRSRPSLAGVSSFGFGGTNAHLVLEQAPGFQDLRPIAGCTESEEVIVPLSAKSPAALLDLALAMRTTLSDPSCELGLFDLAYTAGARRGHHDYRLELVVSSCDEVVEALDAYRRGEPHLSSIAGRRIPGRRPRTVFVFSGQGGLWQGVGRALFQRDPSFRSAIERCDAILSRELGWSLAAEFLADGSSSRIGNPEVDRAVQFALQVGLAALWESWGIVPERSVGDGIGEVVAAYVTGILSLEDAATIIACGHADAAGPARKLTSMPRLPEAIAELAKKGFEVFIEIGPHPILASAVRESLGPRGATSLVLPSLRRGDEGFGSLRWSAAALYAKGFDLEWSRVSPPGHFVRLPGYPWQRERFWLDDGDNHQRTRTDRTRDRKNGLENQGHHGNGKTNGHSAAPVRLLQGPAESQCEPSQALPTVPREFFAPPAVCSQTRGPLDLSTEVRHDRFIQELRGRVATVLEMASDKVDPDRPLLTMGLDSLTAIDLKVEIDASLGVSLPLSRLLEGATIRDLADEAIAQRAGTPTGPIESVVGSLPGDVPGPPAIRERAPGQSGQPLSHGQQMLWYAHQFTKTDAAYHVIGAGSVHAGLDIDALRRAFRRVVARQEALRTVFTVVDEKPAVRLLDLDELVLREDEWLPIEDVSDHGNTEFQKKLTELSGRPFDMEKGPLFRVHVLCRSTTEHVFLLVFHHIIADFWSTAIFLDDFKTAYTAELEGRGITLPSPRTSYADFARWQHTMLASDEGEQHWAYWRDKLAGTLPVLDLPIDFTRPPVQNYRGALRHFYLEPALTRAIVNLGESHGASLYTTLLAAFHVLLGRFSGQHDIVVGTPVAGRTRPGLHDLVGYFVNMLPMRGDLSGNPPFDEFLARVRRTVTDGLEHQDYPFSLLARRLQGSPDPSRPPLFQAMFAHQKIQPLDEQGLAPFALGIPGARLNLYGLAVDSVAFERQTALFDLTMMTAREADRLCVALEYSTDLFKESTIDRMAVSFRNLLEAIVADPRRRIADLPLLSASERHLVLDEWASSLEVTPCELAIHNRFEREVDKSPDAIALVCGEESLTYRELNRLSNALAHRLIELGVKPETVVGLCFDSWPSRVIGVLGVLKAGGAYVPLDPGHPAERLVAILRDSRASVLLTEDHLQDRLEASDVPVITLDVPGKSLGEEDPENPSVSVDPKNLAYVIFTSGTTGRPKGVMVSHGALLAVADAWESAYSLRKLPLRHLQAAGFSFDVFTGDWVRALTTGGTLVACPRSVQLDPSALADLIKRKRIECLELVPAIADSLASHLDEKGENLGGLRLLAVGSDTLRSVLYTRLVRLVGPSGRVVNSYGLTETTIDSTYFSGTPEKHGSDGTVPIGKPFPGTRVYVLNERLEPVPSGVLGDLFIAGSGVARGYVADPRQTAERFLPDPHGAQGSRMYATGDRARWRERGVLELLGRSDGQVKVRGFRVEVGEVETALTQYPGVRASVVVAREDANGEKRLAAYVVPATVPGPDIADLRRWLRDRLPEPIIPSWLISLDAMPLTPNGKVDRSALPSVTEEAYGEQTEYAPPLTTAEEILATIVADLVGRSRVGVHDNLFELGVDSITGIQVVSRARRANLALEPMHLFRHPSIAELARAADAIGEPDDSSQLSTRTVAPFELIPGAIDRKVLERAFTEGGGIEDAYPLTPVHEGMLFHTLVDPEAGNYLEQFVCRVRGDLDLPALRESWQRLVTRHPALRSTIHWTEFDQPCQVVHRRAEHSLDYQDWRELPNSEQEERLMDYLAMDRRRPFVADQPPLSRLALLRVREDVHHLVWSIHHVVIDGWCLSLLLHEVLDIYEAIRCGCEPSLRPSRPFRDYVAWLQHRDEERAESYWRRALSGVTVATPLGFDGLAPYDRGSGEVALERQVRLSTAVTTALQALARSRQLTLSTLIQGAWSVLLSRYSGVSDVLFGVTVSGRPPELPGVESMVGMFINILPLRTEVTEESYLIPWLLKLQADLVELRRFETIPLSRIRTWSDIPAGMPLFESIVTVQNLPFVTSLQQRADRLGIDSARYLERTHYPLAITVLPGAELEIRIGFDAHRFEPWTIERTLGHLQTVLEAMAADPERRIVDLPWMMMDEQAELMGQPTRSQEESHLDDLELDQLTDDELDTLISRLC